MVSQEMEITGRTGITLSVFSYLFSAIIIVNLFPCKERQMCEIGPSPPKICRSSAVKCLFLMSACP